MMYSRRREGLVKNLKMAGEKAEAAGVVIGIESALDAAGEVKFLDEIKEMVGRDKMEEVVELAGNRRVWHSIVANVT